MDLCLSFIVYIHFLQLKWHQLAEVCPTKTAVLFSSLQKLSATFYLLYYRVTVSFILKEIKSKVKSDASHGDFMAVCFLQIFHQGVKHANNVFLSRLYMLKLMAYVRIGFRFNSSDQHWKHTIKLLPFTVVGWTPRIHFQTGTT